MPNDPVPARIAAVISASGRPSSLPWVVRTEPHTVQRYRFLDETSWTLLDLEPHRAAAATRGRRAAFRTAITAVDATLRREGMPGAWILDCSEGWFCTSLYQYLRRRTPAVPMIGVQHGTMEMTGPESLPVARWLRWRTAAALYRAWGYNPVGAGFGNLPFQLYVCYGRISAGYIRRLHRHAETVCSFGSLTRARPGTGERRGPPANLVFFGQDLRPYGVQQQEGVQRAVFECLDRVARVRGWRVLVKPHPKAPLPPDATRGLSALEVTDSVEASLEPGRTVAASYNSTALLEAAYLGCPIVAIRLPGIAPKWYDGFCDTVDLQAFLDGWDGTRFSRLADGLID